MKKKIIVIGLLLLLFAGVAYARMNAAVVVMAGRASGVAYLIDENCEGTGTPTGWVNSASAPDWDNATAPAPLAGAASLSLAFLQTSTSPTFTEQSTVYVGAIFLATALDNAGDLNIVYLRDSSSTILGYLIIRAANTVRVYHGSANATSAGAIAAAQEYYFWLKYVASTETNGVLECRMGTTGVYADATISVSVVVGTRTESVAQISLLNVNSDPGGRIIFDDIVVSSNPIGDM